MKLFNKNKKAYALFITLLFIIQIVSFQTIAVGAIDVTNSANVENLTPAKVYLGYPSYGTASGALDNKAKGEPRITLEGSWTVSGSIKSLADYGAINNIWTLNGSITYKPTSRELAAGTYAVKYIHVTKNDLSEDTSANIEVGYKRNGTMRTESTTVNQQQKANGFTEVVFPAIKFTGDGTEYIKMTRSNRNCRAGIILLEPVADVPDDGSEEIEANTQAEITVENKVFQVGDIVPVKIKVTNKSTQLARDVVKTEFTGIPLQFKHYEEEAVKTFSLAPGESKEHIMNFRVVEGGRVTVFGKVTIGPYTTSMSRMVSISGDGWYSGDTHSHTRSSDGDDIDKNAANAYARGLSFMVATDHNNNSQRTAAQTVTNTYNGDYLQLHGTEITTDWNTVQTRMNPLNGHVLAYGIDYIPNSKVNATDNTWQTVISKVKADGGFSILAHPFHEQYAFPQIDTINDIAGIEIWNKPHEVDSADFKNVIDAWDKHNANGEKLSGTSNSDAHSAMDVGKHYMVFQMNALTKENIFNALKGANLYGTNGPQMRFQIGGAEMGKTLKVPAEGTNTFINIKAFDYKSPLTKVTLIKNKVTGSRTLADRQTVATWDLKGQNLNEWSIDYPVTVSPGDFFRIEIRSEEGSARPNDGIGFAYSNPIYIEQGLSNSAEIINLQYAASQAKAVKDFDGIYYIQAKKDTVISESSLEATLASGAIYTAIYNTGTDSVDMRITAANGEITNKKIYVVRSQKNADPILLPIVVAPVNTLVKEAGKDAYQVTEAVTVNGSYKLTLTANNTLSTKQSILVSIVKYQQNKLVSVESAKFVEVPANTNNYVFETDEFAINKDSYTYKVLVFDSSDKIAPLMDAWKSK